MSNLRDRGYPSAKEYKTNRSDKRNMPMDNNVFQPGEGFLAGNSIIKTGAPVENRGMLDKLLTAYNNKAFGNPNMPLVNRTALDYVTDDTDERAAMKGLAFNNHNGNRLGFVNSNVTPSSTAYYAGIDNLPLGENYYSKEFNLPFGTIGAEYDGDGTASLSYETTPNVYYLKALANLLMNKGSL